MHRSLDDLDLQIPEAQGAESIKYDERRHSDRRHAIAIPGLHISFHFNFDSMKSSSFEFFCVFIDDLAICYSDSVSGRLPNWCYDMVR